MKRSVYLRRGVRVQSGKRTSVVSLQLGFDADFTVLDRDLFQVEDEEIVDAKVVMTVVAGEVMYRG